MHWSAAKNYRQYTAPRLGFADVGSANRSSSASRRDQHRIRRDQPAACQLHLTNVLPRKRIREHHHHAQRVNRGHSGNLTPPPRARHRQLMRLARRYFPLLLVIALVPASGLGAQTAAPDSTRPPEALVPSPTDPAANARVNLPTPANPALRSLFLVGDSTVRNGQGDGANGQWGWGEPLAGLFDSSKINVVNRAIGGRSSRTYITEGQWAATLAVLKPGDIVLFQFGHNDSGPLDDPARARGSLPGTSDDTREIENPLLHAHEVVHTYGWYLRDYIVETIARGATPILCTPIPRKLWKDGKVERNADTYGGWARAIAVQQRVPLLDLNEIIAEKYEALGQPAVESLFADPHTHTSRAGAELNAEAVVAALKALPTDPLAGYFSASGNAVPAAAPSAASTSPTPKAAQNDPAAR